MSDCKAPAGWLRAIDEALVAAHIGIASESDDYDTAKRKINALIDWHVAIATDPAVNGGWKLVPVEPTPEMVDAAFSGMVMVQSVTMQMKAIERVSGQYKAMLAAAPTPPVHAENTSQERVRNQAENEHEPDLAAAAKMLRNIRSNSCPTTEAGWRADALYVVKAALRDFSDPYSDDTTTEPTLSMPEPMTDNELVEIYRALPKNSPLVRDGSTTGRLARAIEAEVLRRVREANK